MSGRTSRSTTRIKKDCIHAEPPSGVIGTFTNAQILLQTFGTHGKPRKMMQKSEMLIEELNSHEDTAMLGMIIPTDNDVLCGRGKTNFFHEGNTKFRQLVGANLEAYINANNRSQKSAIVKEIADRVLKQGGRFLKLEKGVWLDGGVKTAREKVGHALRDACSSKSQSIMDIHLERVRSKANAPKRQSPNDVTLGHAQGETYKEIHRSEAFYNDDCHALDEESASELDSFCLEIDIPEEELNEHYSPLRVLPEEGCRHEDLANSSQTNGHLSWSGTSIDPIVEVGSSMDEEAVDLYSAHAFRHSQM